MAEADRGRATPTITGGCQCGAVRYGVAAEPLEVSLCHCRMCQKASGGAFMTFARVPLEAVTWTRGAPTAFESSSLARRGFCSACGTPLTYQWRPDAISLTTGSMDEPARYPPTARLGAEAVISWSEHIADLPIEPTDSWLGAETKARFVDHQHPDHDI